MSARYYVVIAWLEDAREIVRARRNDLGEAPIMRDTVIAKAVTWSIVDVDTASTTDNGEAVLRRDLDAARVFAEREHGKRCAVDIWGASVDDPLEKSRVSLLRAAGVT